MLHQKAGIFYSVTASDKNNKSDADNCFIKYKLALRDKISFYQIETIPDPETANDNNSFWKNYVCIQLTKL